MRSMHNSRIGDTPNENAFGESCNEMSMDECLNMNMFWALASARNVIGVRRIDYNEGQPHGSLEDLTPSFWNGTMLS